MAKYNKSIIFSEAHEYANSNATTFKVALKITWNRYRYQEVGNSVVDTLAANYSLLAEASKENNMKIMSGLYETLCHTSNGYIANLFQLAKEIGKKANESSEYTVRTELIDAYNMVQEIKDSSINKKVTKMPNLKAVFHVISVACRYNIFIPQTLLNVVA